MNEGSKNKIFSLPTSFSRRAFIKKILASLIFYISFKAHANDSSNPSSPRPEKKKYANPKGEIEKELHYTKKSYLSKHKNHFAGDKCASCKFYSSEQESDGYAPCLMMRKRYVSSLGWCMLYTKKLSPKKTINRS